MMALTNQSSSFLGLDKVSRDITLNVFAATGVAPAREVSVGSEPVSARVPEPPRGPHKFPRQWIFIAVAAVLAGALLSRLAQPRQKSAASPSSRTAVVERKDFVAALRLHGVVEAVESHPVAAPRLSGQGLGTLLITKLALGGSTVHKGDVLAEFDRQAQLRNVLDKQAEYRDLVEQIKKKQADQAAARATDETDLKQAEDAQKTAELEVKKNEILSKIDAEKNQLNLEQAQATLKQYRETFNLKRRADQADLRVLEIQRDRAQAAMLWAQGNTQKMLIRSDVDGVVVINSMWKGGSLSDVQEGDEVRSGFAFLQVVNPGQMQIRLRANQADVVDLQEGQAAVIHLDAYPDLEFSGKVERVAAVAQTSAFYGKLRYVNVMVSIQGSDPKLLPDLSAAVDVQFARDSNVLVAPRDAITNDGGHSYVKVKSGSGYERREVKLGPASDIEQVIISGVEKGAVLLRGL